MFGLPRSVSHEHADDEVDSLEREVDRIRNNIGALVRELNHRRHEAFDLKLQLREHAGRVVLAGVAVASLIAGSDRARRSRACAAGGASSARMRRLREALRRIAAHPERLAERRPNVSRKVAAAGGSAIASVPGEAVGQAPRLGL